MTSKMITVPELGIIAGTRAAPGAGIGLLMAGRIDAPRRRAIGWRLVALVALRTIPLALQILSREETAPPSDVIPEASLRAQRELTRAAREARAM